MAFQKRPKHFWGKMMNKKKKVTNWAKTREQKNTTWHQNVSQNPPNPDFCSVKMVHVEVVLFLTLERLKRGTETNSPTDIYIYIYINIF